MKLIAITALLLAVPAAASTPEAMAQGLIEARNACAKASDLKQPILLGTPLMFSDTNGKTVMLLSGRWRPAHMKNARATILCSYDRAGKTAEVQEAKGWSAR